MGLLAAATVLFVGKNIPVVNRSGQQLLTSSRPVGALRAKWSQGYTHLNDGWFYTDVPEHPVQFENLNFEKHCHFIQRILLRTSNIKFRPRTDFLNFELVSKSFISITGAGIAQWCSSGLRAG
jgi:hypothetical protein